VFDDAIRAPVAIRGDATAIELAIGALGAREPRTRRLALELLEGSDDPRALDAIRGALRDDDATVRAAATRTLAGSLTPDELAAGMRDGDPTVRAAAIEVAPHDAIPASLFDDPDDSVAVMAAVRALGGSGREAATAPIERRLADPRPDVRALALRALARDAPPADADRWARGALDDPSPVVRARALEVLAAASPAAVVEPSLEAIASPEIVVRNAARTALRRADLRDHTAELETTADRWSSLALADGATAASIASDGAEVTLLRDALRARARARALVSLSIRTARSRDPAATDLALEILADGGSELANALETIETAAPAGRPLLALWEPATDGAHGAADVDAIADDDDPFIRACADLVRSRREGDGMARTRGATSPIERVLALRAIPLFAALEPAEVQQVAAITSERTYADGEMIDAEGELGDEMHVVVAGSVRVERGGETIARRGPGDIIGEMSVITRAPRIASLIAEGDVRTLRIANREFEGMLRERPEIAIGVMRVLAERLGTASARASTES
jgi:HEAT repeat protein